MITEQFATKYRPMASSRHKSIKTSITIIIWTLRSLIYDANAIGNQTAANLVKRLIILSVTEQNLYSRRSLLPLPDAGIDPCLKIRHLQAMSFRAFTTARNSNATGRLPFGRSYCPTATDKPSCQSQRSILAASNSASPVVVGGLTSRRQF